MDTIIYLKHNGNKFTMKPMKLTGYTKFYGEVSITGKNGYKEHLIALKRLAKLGYCVSKMEDLEQQAGITPPKKKETPKKETVIEEEKPSVEKKTTDEDNDFEF